MITDAVTSFLPSDEKVINLNDYSLDDSLETLNTVIELPEETSIKYEMDADESIVADRFMSMSVVYPANYGFIPETTAGDGDPLDVLVYTREALV